MFHQDFGQFREYSNEKILAGESSLVKNEKQMAIVLSFFIQLWLCDQ